jgi:hypothetical protein
VLAVIAVAAGITVAVAVSDRQGGARRAASVAQPLLVDAQVVDTALSDADATAAGGFLAGPVTPTASNQRLRADLASAGAALTGAAQRGGTATSMRQPLQQLNIDLPIYAGLIQTAQANNRQGFPVAAAYLGEASNLMRTGLLPAASSLYQAAERRLAAEDATARGSGLLIIAIVLLALALISLVWLQLWLAPRFHRALNPGMLAATVATIAVIVWVVIAVSAESSAVRRAQDQGAAPLGRFTQARIAALQARADDELTLSTRDAVASYQKDFPIAAAQVHNLLNAPTNGWSPPEKNALAQAASAFAAYQAAHDQVRRLDQGGNLNGAIAADRAGAADAANRLSAALSDGVTIAVAQFQSAATSAGQDLDGLAWGGLALMVIGALAIIVGAQRRLAEYR